MEPTFTYPQAINKAQLYEAFLADFRPYIEGETDIISLMANTSAALHEAFGFFWVGFYIVADEQWLHLGPFQGTAACTRIRHGRGVCGTAWAEDKTLIVPDVDKFPGHIACSSASRSEIVVPVHDKAGTVIAILDIDSARLAAFDETDREGLEAIVSTFEQTLFP
ncbi:MAG: GAF domain-containing protein [Bacteroidaceae bacterium]|nr:GAF domain-containing protein [Bacteroidaceae bacterium]